MQGRYPSCLRSCSILLRHGSYPQFRFYTTKVLRGEDLGPVQHDEHQTFRVRQSGAKLPLPPVLDPVVLSERSRWQQPKARPDMSVFTPFQKKLYANPYAHALASPVRQCRTANILLPSSLLIALHPRPHPTTQQLWLVPVALTTSTHHLGPPLYFLGYSSVAAFLGKKRAWEKALSQRFLTQLGRTAASDLVWREDMPTLILNMLRKKVAKKMHWYFKHSGQLVPCASPRAEDLDGVEDVSCVLCVGSLKTRADEVQAETHAIVHDVDRWAAYFAKGFPGFVDPHKEPGVTHRAPPWYTEPLVPRLPHRLRFPPLEFKTTVWRGRKVAVYSLHDLLGEEKTRKLLEGSKYERERCLAMRTGRHNIPVELLLMQLQAYTATSGP